MDGYCNAYVTLELDQTLRDFNRLAEARDIFTLGIVLWQIAEDVGRFRRWQRSEPPILVTTLKVVSGFGYQLNRVGCKPAARRGRIAI